MKTIKSELTWFISITLPATYAVGLLLWQFAGLDKLVSIATMYIPATVVILLYYFKFRKPVFRKGDLGFRFTGMKYWFIAPVVLSALCILSYLVSWLIDPALFSPAATIAASLSAKGFYWGNIWYGLITIFLVNGILGSIIDIPMFLGEEVGWRGFMVPRLLKIVSPPKAFLIGGTVWALWHVVMIAQGLNYPGHFIPGIFMMILMAIPVGIIIQYFYARSGSIFVAAMAHAALNKTAMSMSFVLNKDHYNTLLYGPTGVAGILLFSVVAVYLYRRIDWAVMSEPQSIIITSPATP